MELKVGSRVEVYAQGGSLVNPFNGIESKFMGVDIRVAVICGNPFNGIERGGLPPGFFHSSSSYESVQWN